MSALRTAALRLEMANGRVNALGGGGGEKSIGEAKELVAQREAERRAFHMAVEETTGMSAGELARLLTL